MGVMQLRFRMGKIPGPADLAVPYKPEVMYALRSHCSHPHNMATVLPLARWFSVSPITLSKLWSETDVPNAENIDVVITVRFCTQEFKG